MKKIFILISLFFTLPVMAFASTHQDINNNYQLTLPDGWKILSKTDVTYEENEVLYAENGLKNILSVDVFNNDDFNKSENYGNAFNEQERQEMIADTKHSFSKLYPGIQINTAEFLDVNGVPALIVTGTFFENGVQNSLAAMDMLKSSKVYILYLVTQKTLEKNTQEFWEIINTFKTLN